VQPHFEVSRAGLAKLVERRGKAFAILELVQNAWDEEAKEVSVTLEAIADSDLARLVVEDDDPHGFSDLAHAYTLYAESEKKKEPGKRGRFNLGEKLVLAMCVQASISTTTGTISFDGEGRRHHTQKRERGSKFEGLLPMSVDEIQEAEAAVETLIAPAGVRTTFNGCELARREPVAEFEATLASVLADGDGYLRPTRRRTCVRVYEPLPGRAAALYELGIPVVETGDRWDLDIGQKVPLNSDRDNVPPAFLRDLRALALNAMHDRLDGESASEGWIGQGLESPDISPEAVSAVLEARYGAKRVIADPSDPEGTKIAVSRGYAVIQPGSFNRRQWEAIRSSKAALPAGQVTPSPRPYGDDPNAPTREELARSKWTPGMEKIVAFTEVICEHLTGERPRVILINEFAVAANATYGKGIGPPQFEYNVARLGRKWFEQDPTSEAVLSLIIHEAGHHFEKDHLSSAYYRALTTLGARLTRLALEKPELFVNAERGED
jgi:hypothetical protein